MSELWGRPAIQTETDAVYLFYLCVFYPTVSVDTCLTGGLVTVL